MSYERNYRNDFLTPEMAQEMRRKADIEREMFNEANPDLVGKTELDTLEEWQRIKDEEQDEQVRLQEMNRI